MDDKGIGPSGNPFRPFPTLVQPYITTHVFFHHQQIYGLERGGGGLGFGGGAAGVKNGKKSSGKKIRYNKFSSSAAAAARCLSSKCFKKLPSEREIFAYRLHIMYICLISAGFWRMRERFGVRLLFFSQMALFPPPLPLYPVSYYLSCVSN